MFSAHRWTLVAIAADECLKVAGCLLICDANSVDANSMPGMPGIAVKQTPSMRTRRIEMLAGCQQSPNRRRGGPTATTCVGYWPIASARCGWTRGGRRSGWRSSAVWTEPTLQHFSGGAQPLEHFVVEHGTHRHDAGSRALDSSQAFVTLCDRFKRSVGAASESSDAVAIPENRSARRTVWLAHRWHGRAAPGHRRCAKSSPPG